LLQQGLIFGILDPLDQLHHLTFQVNQGINVGIYFRLQINDLIDDFSLE